MSKLSLLFLAFQFSSLLFAGNPDIDACLKAWGKTPFKNDYTFRKLNVNVKVLGIGGNIRDDQPTPQPELILVTHSVSVLSYQKFELLNPNGWYCVKGSVTVLGKSHFITNCKAHVMSSDDGVTIAGSNQDSNGVTVLGKVEVEKIGCEAPKQD